MPASQTSSPAVDQRKLDEGSARITELATDIARMMIERSLSYEGTSAALVIARCLYDRSKNRVIRRHHATS